MQESTMKLKENKIEVKKNKEKKIKILVKVKIGLSLVWAMDLKLSEQLWRLQRNLCLPRHLQHL